MMQAVYPKKESDGDRGDKDMRVWLACFLVLFALAELFDWLQGFSFPLPIYILGGAFLAVASNYEKIVGSYFSDSSQQPPLESFPPASTNVAIAPSHQAAETPEEENSGT